MPFLDINGWELIVLAVVGVVVLGPERLPQYAAKLARLVRQLKAMAEGAQTQLKEQMGPEFENVNWRQYDPRQYDPRRIVREALFDEPSTPAADTTSEPAGAPVDSPAQSSASSMTDEPADQPAAPGTTSPGTSSSGTAAIDTPMSVTPATRWDEAT